ncbi:MAG: hypothetical protein K2M50_00955 [Treponemataceae bacterium]|nr:hypothetical protein [Treponemataceae bacterium]
MKKILSVGAVFAALLLSMLFVTGCSNDAEGAISVWKIKGTDGSTYSTLYFYEDGTWKCTGSAGLSGYSGTYEGDTTVSTGRITLFFGNNGYGESYYIRRDRDDVWLYIDDYAYCRS